MITFPSELLGQPKDCAFSRALSFLPFDEGSVFNGLFSDGMPGSVPGTVHVCKRSQHLGPEAIGWPEDVVRIIARPRRIKTNECEETPASAATFELKGYVRRQDHWEEMPVQAVPVYSELHSRSKGLLETDVLSDAVVFQAGIGSGGAPILVELAKCGVGSFYAMDHDRIEVGNVWRHIAGLRDVGRYKTRFIADAIRQKNPGTIVQTWEKKVCRENAELIRQIVQKVGLVICAVDDPPTIVLMNKICVEENKILIIAGAFRRAYGGQILVVKPRVSPCYECFRRSLPEKAMDREISSTEQAQRVSYSDRPVAIEPGLSNDILPISTMVVKLALVELLRDKTTTLRSLGQDLVAPWFLFLNRREAGTDYEKLAPLEFNLDGMHILRWYGIDLRRWPDCPCCGDFVTQACQSEGIQIEDADAAEFAS